MSHWFDDLARGSVERSLSRRQAIDGGAKAIALAALVTGPVGAITATPVAAESYCLGACHDAARENYRRRANTCNVTNPLNPERRQDVFELMLEGGRLACSGTAYALFHDHLYECSKPNCGDAATYPRPPVDDCANCESVGGICCGVTTDPDGRVRIAACNNPTHPCGT